MRAELAQKYDSLQRQLKAYGKVAVAFSGGVDSALLLAAAHLALPGNVLALTASSCVLPRAELLDAQRFAQQWNIPHQTVEVDFLTIPGVAENPPDRCYLCKRALLNAFCQAAEQAEFPVVVEGSNVDDWDDYRPGRRALEESPVKSPLCDAGLTKAEIRELSRELNLSTWAKPSAACLASRIPYGEPLTPQNLQMAGRAEQLLHEMGFGQVRVRCHGSQARIECAPEEFARFLEPDTRETIWKKMKEIGFLYTALDLRGYRTGSLNECLPKKEESR